MIQRGTVTSRALALLIAASPVLLVGGGFASWAISRWIDGGAAIASAEQRRHEAVARTTQAKLYAPLGEAWAEYAVTDVSGLAQDANAAETEAAVRARIEGMFAEAKGALRIVERMEDGPPPRPGLQHMRFELRGAAPESETPALLAALEAEPPFLFVEFLDLARPEAGQDRNLGRLEIRLRVSVYRFAEADA